jgi:hypothetical protein
LLFVKHFPPGPLDREPYQVEEVFYRGLSHQKRWDACAKVGAGQLTLTVILDTLTASEMESLRPHFEKLPA